MKRKIYGWMNYLLMLGFIILGGISLSSIKVEAADTNNGYYKISDKLYINSSSKWKLFTTEKYTTYDKHGNLIEYMHRYASSSNSSKVSYEYKYTKKGKVLSKKTLSDKIPMYYETYTYDKKGNAKTYKRYGYKNSENGREKYLINSSKYTYKNGKLYKEISNDYGGQFKILYDKYGNITKQTFSNESVSFINTYKNTYKKGVLSCVECTSIKNESNPSKYVYTTTYYTSGYRKGQEKQCITQEYEKNNENWIEIAKDTVTYKYKADKTGKNVGEVTKYENGTPTTKHCYTWKKMK